MRSSDAKRRTAPSFASLASVALHVALVYVATTCPVGPDFDSVMDSRRAMNAGRVTRRATERLTYIMPRTASTSVLTPLLQAAAPAEPTTSETSRVSSDDAAAAMTSDTSQVVVADSATIAATSATSRPDSSPAPSRGYERPIHPALRGLVPEWKSGPLWGSSPSAVHFAQPPLRPRPPDCSVDNIPCKRRLFQWRADSVFHVTYSCRVDPRNPTRMRPPDCALFLTDSSSEWLRTTEFR